MLDPLSKPASAKPGKTSRQPMSRARRGSIKSRSNGQGSTSLKSFNAPTSDELLLTPVMAKEAEILDALALRKNCRVIGLYVSYKGRRR